MMTPRANTKSLVKTPAALEFAGFPAEGFRFLRQLKRNNDRDWFRERKADYERYVEQPMRALVLAVARECHTHGIPLHAKEKNPVMRVYRDIRFSKDKRPFKTHVAAELRRSFVGGMSSNCIFYIHLSPEESFLAAGVWQPERPLLNTWRETIVNEPVRFKKMCNYLARKGLEVSKAHALSSMPRGFQQHSEELTGPYLKLTSFVVSRPLQSSECTKPACLKAVVDFARAAKPLLEFGWYIEDTYAGRIQKPVLVL